MAHMEREFEQLKLRHGEEKVNRIVLDKMAEVDELIEPILIDTLKRRGCTALATPEGLNFLRRTNQLRLAV